MVSSCSALRVKPYFTAPYVSCFVISGVGSSPESIGLVGDAVETHVGVVHVAKDADRAFAIRRKQVAEQRFAQLELPVLAAGLAQIPVEVDAVGDGRHQRESVAGRPVLIVVLGDGGVGVTAGIGGIVPRAIVVDGPVHELQVAVASRCC